MSKKRCWKANADSRTPRRWRLGQLTGGIAHDFNNLLLVITGNLELLEPHLDRDESRVLLKEAQDATALGSKLTDQLLTLARRRHMDAHDIQLNDLVVSITSVAPDAGRAHNAVDFAGTRAPIPANFRAPL